MKERLNKQIGNKQIGGRNMKERLNKLEKTYWRKEYEE
jgi:hypothetical protein